MLVQNVPDLSTYFECVDCYYLTSHKRDYIKHLETNKHKKRTNNYHLITDNYPKEEKVPSDIRPYKCKCGKDYIYKQNLYTHRKKCLFKENNVNKIINTEIISEEKEQNINEDVNYKEMFLEMVKQNKILQSTICELIPKVGYTNITNNTNNTTNNFNVSVFLNDNCKDALSINDFINLVKLDVSDLLFTCKNGLTNGISNIFIENFNKLPLVKRPLWCSDKKRRKLFIKEEIWEEDTNSEKTKAAIKQLTSIQAKNAIIYAKSNPDWIKHDNKKDTYMGIIKETTGSVDDKMEKIIDKIIDKSQLNNETREKITKK